MKRKLFKIVLVSVASAVVLLIAAILFITSSIGENLVRGWLQRRLTAEIGLPVAIGRFETNIWSRVQIDSLAVGTGARIDSSTGTDLYVGHIHVGYSIPQLLGETVALRELRIDSLVLAIALDSVGRFGIPVLDMPPPDTAEAAHGAKSIRIDTVALTGMVLAYLDPQLPLSIEMTEARLSAKGYETGDYSGRFGITEISVLYDSIPVNIEDFEIAASVKNEEVQIESVAAYCEGLKVNATGSLEIAEPERLTLTSSIRGRLDTLASTISAAFGLSNLSAGEMRSQLRIDGTLDRPSAEIDAQISEIAWRDISIPTAMLRARYNDSLITIDSFRVSTLDGIVSGSGSMALDSMGAGSASIALAGIDVAAAWKLIYGEPSQYSGTVAGHIAANGWGYDLGSWTVDAALVGTGLSYLNRSVPELKCRAILRQSRVDLALTHGRDEIHVDLGMSGDTIDGTFGVSVPDLAALARLADQPELSGGLWADGTISGTYSSPAIYSTITGSGIAYRDFPVDSIRAEVTYRDSAVVVEDLYCGGSLDEIDPSHPPFDLDSISGGFSYTCEMEGPLDHLSGQFSARTSSPQYGEYALDSLSIEVQLDGSRIDVTALDVFRNELGVSLHAAYDTATSDGSFDLRLYPLMDRIDSLPDPSDGTVPRRNQFGSINGTFAIKSGVGLSAAVKGQELWLGLLPLVTGDSTEIDGEVEFDLNVDGPFLTPDATLRATARSIGITGYRIDSLSTDMSLTRGAFAIDSLAAYTLGNTLTASGQIELAVSEDGSPSVDSNARVNAQLSTSNFDLSVLGMFLQPGAAVSGVVSAALMLDGTLASPSLKGWLLATEGMLLLEESSEALDDIEVALSFEDSVLTIDSASCTVSDLQLSTFGSLAVSSFESVDVDVILEAGSLGRLSIEGSGSDTHLQLKVISDSLNLAVLLPFMPAVDSLTGTLGCSMLILGRPADPMIDGSLRVSGLAVQAPEQHIRLSDGNVGIRFDKNHIHLDSAWASLNGGKIGLSGTVSHDAGELTDIAMTLRAHGVSFQEPESFAIAVDSAEITYGRHRENYILGGDIVLGEARLTTGVRLTSVLPWVRSVETVELELPDLIARSRLDIRIRESDQLWVDNNLARIRLRAELGVIGTPLRPNFTGLLKVEEGYLMYLDRRFRVNRGMVYFNDPARFNPDIDLDASTEVKVYRRTAAETYTVYIKAEGVLDQLQYGLYSEPVLDKSDIVALLTLGATRTELVGNGDNEGQVGLRGALADRVSMLTSRKVSGYLSRKAGSFFGFDEFTIEGNLFRFDDSWGPQLVASKRLSRRVDLTYSTTVGHLNDQTVRLGYRLTPRVSLQGETDRQGNAGLDLKYGITFK